MNDPELDLSQPPSDGGPPDGRWREPDIRGALYATNGPVCAYCQREVGGYGHVEHFRPRSHYPWLAYEVRNLVTSCGPCNLRKSDSFPVTPASRRTKYERRHRLNQEPRELLSPLDDDVNGILIVNDDILFEANDRCGELERQRAAFTIEFFRLNVDPRIVRKRRKDVSRAYRIATEVLKGNESWEDELWEMCSRYSQNGSIVRFLFERDQLSGILPNFESELQLHIKEIVDVLLDCGDELQKPIRSNAIRRDLQQLRMTMCWALALLIEEPPTSDSPTVLSWIESATSDFDVLAVLQDCLPYDPQTDQPN